MVNLSSLLTKYFSGSFMRYVIMAVTVVCIELASFWFINSVLNLHYLVATVLSLLIGVVLNWLGSRYLVFGASQYSQRKEFFLVAIVSLIGILLQSFIVLLTVEVFKQFPLVGKVIAIGITFVWNYWFRAKIIYSDNDSKKYLLSTGSSLLKNKALIYSLLSLSVFAILLWRFPNNVFAANFYGEDGSVYLQNILDKGPIAAAFSTFNGYFVSGLYILCFLGSFINLFFGNTIFTLPAAYAVSALFFMSAVIALPYLLFTKFWGERKVLLIIILCALMPLPITPHVVLGTIGNQKWIFTYLAFILILYRILSHKKIPKRKVFIIDAVLLICAYTNVTTYLLVPFLLIPFAHELIKSRKKRITLRLKTLFQQTEFRSMLVLYVLLIPQVIYVFINGIPKFPGYLDTPYNFTHTVEIFINRTFLFGFTSFAHRFLNDFLVVVIFLIILYFGLVKLKKNDRFAFIFGLFAALVASLLFVANRPGVSDFFGKYSPLGTGPDQFFYAQTLIMYIPLVLVLSYIISLFNNKKVQKTLWVGAFSILTLGSLHSILVFGDMWRNASIFENDAGIFTDQAIATCNSTNKNSDVRTIVYPYANGGFSIHTNYSFVCNKDLGKYQKSKQDLGLVVHDNDYLAVTRSKQFIQTFRASQNNLNGIRIYLSGFGRDYRKSSYTLELYDQTCSNLIRSVTLPKNTQDGFYNAHFQNVRKSANNAYCFTITPPKDGQETLAVQRSAPNIYSGGNLIENSKVSDKDVVFLPLYNPLLK